MNIVEIGGGYGGTAPIIEKLFKPRSYTIIDLPGPLQLTKKFLNVQKMSWGWYLKPRQIALFSHYDLVISNYAFSECTTENQEDYLERILSKSKNGYITCNQPGKFQDQQSRSYTRNELKVRLKKAEIPFKIVTEKPLTYDLNYLIIWKNNPNYQN